MKRTGSAHAVPVSSMQAPRTAASEAMVNQVTRGRERSMGAGPCVTAPAGSRLDLSRRDRVLERVGIEAVAPALRGLGLRIHEEAELSALGGAWKRHVVRGVECDPVALPATEQLGTHRLDERMLDLQPLARLLARHLGDVGGIHGHPAIVFQEDLGATVLGLADVGAPRPERLVAEAR